MTLSKKKIKKIQLLRDEGFSVRKIAKRLSISTDSVCKYSRPLYSIEEPTVRQKIFYSRHATPRNRYKIVEKRPLPIEDEFTHSIWETASRSRYYEDIYPIDQEYPRKVSPIPGWNISFMDRSRTPVPHIKHQEPEPKAPQKPLFQILQEQQKEKKIEELSGRLDRLIKSEREDRERKKKQEQDEQNLKAERQRLQLRQQKNEELEKDLHKRELVRIQLDAEQKKKERHKKKILAWDSFIESHSKNIREMGELENEVIAREIAVSFITELSKVVSQVVPKWLAQKSRNSQNNEYKHVKLIPIVKLIPAKDKNQ